METPNRSAFHRGPVGAVLFFGVSRFGLMSQFCMLVRSGCLAPCSLVPISAPSLGLVPLTRDRTLMSHSPAEAFAVSQTVSNRPPPPVKSSKIEKAIRTYPLAIRIVSHGILPGLVYLNIVWYGVGYIWNNYRLMVIFYERSV